METTTRNQVEQMRLMEIQRLEMLKQWERAAAARRRRAPYVALAATVGVGALAILVLLLAANDGAAMVVAWEHISTTLGKGIDFIASIVEAIISTY